MLWIAGMLVGTFYWNDQLSFGVEMPKIFPHCTGVSDAPDRGVYVLLDNNESCPDLRKESLFDYVERKRIPAVAVIAWYNAVEEFDNSLELAGAYCSKNRIHKKKMNYGDVYYCFVKNNKKISLRGFFQLRQNTKNNDAVNVEFYLNKIEKKYQGEYWRVVESLVFSSEK